MGWPPVRSFRKNIVTVQKKSTDQDQADKTGSTSTSAAAFVKVSMDGAPYLRKVDLKLYQSYQELSGALGKMFSSFTIGNFIIYLFRTCHSRSDFLLNTKGFLCSFFIQVVIFIFMFT